MIKFLSYILAVIFTALLALALYPICGVCYLFSLIGKISNCLFGWTNKTIKNLWADINTSSIS